MEFREQERVIGAKIRFEHSILRVSFRLEAGCTNKDLIVKYIARPKGRKSDGFTGNLKRTCIETVYEIYLCYHFYFFRDVVR